MKDQRLTVQIDRPAKDVFAFTINPANTPKWIDAIVTEQTNEWPPKIGTIYRNRGTDGVWREITLTSLDTGNGFVMSEQDGFHIRYTFTQLDANTTELECYLWMDAGELRHLFDIGVLEKLKRVIEADA